VTISPIFRGLILVSALLIVASYLVPYVYPYLSDQDFWTLAGWDGHAAILPSTPLIYWGLPIIWIAVLAGLYYYVALARTLLAVLLAATPIMSLLEGVRVFHPLDTFLGSIMFPIYGALLAMAYFTSVSRQFAVRPVDG
jgi:hypothetical protein